MHLAVLISSTEQMNQLVHSSKINLKVFVILSDWSTMSTFSKPVVCQSTIHVHVCTVAVKKGLVVLQLYGPFDLADSSLNTIVGTYLHVWEHMYGCSLCSAIHNHSSYSLYLTNIMQYCSVTLLGIPQVSQDVSEHRRDGRYHVPFLLLHWLCECTYTIVISLYNLLRIYTFSILLGARAILLVNWYQVSHFKLTWLHDWFLVHVCLS